MSEGRKRPSEVIGGPVDSDVSMFRGTEYLVRFSVIPETVCHQCGSGEVWHPMQTADLPVYLMCLRCGEAAPSSEFQYSGDSDE